MLRVRVHSVPERGPVLLGSPVPVLPGDLPTPVMGSAPRVSVAPVDVLAVPDPPDDNLSPLVINSVEDAVGATAGAPDAFQFVTKRRSDVSWVFEQWPGDELDDGRCKAALNTERSGHPDRSDGRSG